jgi:hypothetical protein
MVEFVDFYVIVVISITFTLLIYTFVEMFEAVAQVAQEKDFQEIVATVSMIKAVDVPSKPPPPPPPLPEAMKFDTKLIFSKSSKQPIAGKTIEPMDSLLNELKKRTKTVLEFE